MRAMLAIASNYSHNKYIGNIVHGILATKNNDNLGSYINRQQSMDLMLATSRNDNSNQTN